MWIKSKMYLIFMYFLLCMAVTSSQIRVCIRKELHETRVSVTLLESYNVTGTRWCLNWALRCPVIISRHRIVKEEHVISSYKPVEFCCLGYEYDTAGHCIAACSPACVHGHCVSPQVCKCQPGYQGDTCNEVLQCRPGFWGQLCQNTCNCARAAICDHFTGKCHCPIGWMGKKCMKKCPKDRYGQDCASICQCRNREHCHPATGACEDGSTADIYEETMCINGGTFDTETGTCVCPAGWTGRTCSYACQSQYWGEKCANKCVCDTGMDCHPVTGNCACMPGFTEDMCVNQCPPGFWGENCTNRCECYNAASCNHFTGHCDCPPGLMGLRCQSFCKEGTFGKSCAEECSCANNATCLYTNGTCICDTYWTGDKCTVRICPNGQRASDLHPSHCICSNGKMGDRCDESSHIKIYESSSSAAFYSTIFIIIFIVLVIVVSCVITQCSFYCKIRTWTNTRTPVSILQLKTPAERHEMLNHLPRNYHRALNHEFKMDCSEPKFKM